MLTLKPSVKRLRFVAALAVVFLVLLASAANTALANVYCLLNCDGRYGETTWLSCGSSGGNYFATCPADGGPCRISDARSQPEADAMCQQRNNQMLPE